VETLVRLGSRLAQGRAVIRETSVDAAPAFDAEEERYDDR
jgi:hypothetical protein